jgi:hypothetical protein
MGWEIGQLAGFGLGIGDLSFGGTGRRRGADVKPLKIGSRDGGFCIWGNLGFCAELRRNWGLEFWFAWELVGCYVGGVRRGDKQCFSNA